ncbi:LOW QUALITY PROTEIN: protein SSUH2 homolog [Ciconia maguari]
MEKEESISIFYISVDEAKDAFIKSAACTCCHRTVPPKYLVVRSLTALNTYYQLQMFTESRSTLPASEPYRGTFVDSPETAVPLGPWDVAVDPAPLFAACEMHLPVPHTYRSNVNGIGRCFSCRGEGRVPCAWRGMKGLLLCHSELTITRKNSVAAYGVDKNQGFPPSRFQEVTGKQLFSNEHHLSFPQPVVQGAESGLALHRMQVSEEARILRQKHAVELIPLTRIEYEWQGKAYSFYVFGKEKQVYAEDYPGKCCCAIL